MTTNLLPRNPRPRMRGAMSQMKASQTTSPDTKPQTKTPCPRLGQNTHMTVPEIRGSTRTRRKQRTPGHSCTGCCHKLKCLEPQNSSGTELYSKDSVTNYQPEPKPQPWAKHHPAVRSPSSNQPPRPASGNIRARASSR